MNVSGPTSDVPLTHSRKNREEQTISLGTPCSCLFSVLMQCLKHTFADARRSKLSPAVRTTGWARITGRFKLSAKIRVKICDGFNTLDVLL